MEAAMTQDGISSTQSMDIRRILDLLPHRYPFLLVDRVVECVPLLSLIHI